MRVVVDGKPREMRALWWENDVLHMLDQRVLPHRVEILTLRTASEVADAIREMAVRGAPAIGAAAAYGMALGARNVEATAALLSRTRPTAVNLFHAIGAMREAISRGDDPIKSADAYVEDVVASCRRIGEAGLPLVRDGARVLTHCNAGALATVDLGTATAPLRLAHKAGRRIRVFCDETRPRLQGVLTAWELSNEGVDAILIPDNAAAHLMARGEVDVVIVGADRIAANGDVANKIGTYGKALAAREHRIPFYVAAPASTFDAAAPDGKAIPIEERDPSEVFSVAGSRAVPPGIPARNPAFDVTPAKFVTGYVTDRGLLDAAHLSALAPGLRR